MGDFRKRLSEGVVLFDGAMGTALQNRGLEPGMPPETMLLEDFELVAEIHGEYARAGAEVITTNSFGANSVKISEFGLEDRFEEINRLAVRAAKKHAQGAFIAGDMGPTGRFVEPVGDLAWDVAVETFGKQARIQADEGVDLFIIETMSDIRELKAAIFAISPYGLPIVAMMTFEESGRSTLGTPPEVAAVVMNALGVDVIGSNCSVGPDGIERWLAAMRKVVSAPLVSMPNAGLPKLDGDKTVFPLGPSEMAEWVERFLDLGCIVIGSCCGSTPAHTRALAVELERLGKEWRRPPADPLPGVTRLASRSKVVLIGPGQPPAAVGERINPTGKKEFSAELKRGELDRIKREARLQESSGIDVIDLNVGVPGVNEPELMREAVFGAESACSLPIAIDSSDPLAVEAGLAACAGKPLINSVRGDRKSLKNILPLARKYGAAVLGLCMDEKEVPQTAGDRIKIARRILRATTKAGIPDRDVLLDPVTVPASADPKQPAEALRSVRYFSEKLNRATMQGVSNVSFGLPKRAALNAAYLAMAIEEGLSASFVNFMDEKTMEVFYAARVLTDNDPAANEYIKFATRSETDTGKPTSEKAERTEISSWEDALKDAVMHGETSEVLRIVNSTLEKGVSPMDVSERAMVPAIREVGRLFETGEIFLPNLMLSAQAMEAGMAIVNGAIEKHAKVEAVGTVVLATAEGDIHDIGKNIVATILRTNGWRVLDLGKSVKAEAIIREAVESSADVVGISALMTTTVVRIPQAVELLHKKGIPVMIGGAVVTKEYADEIGADFYGADAMAALRGAEKLKK